MANRLIGEYERKVDNKRRFFIPAEFRISQSWIVTAGLEKCLFLFPGDEWDRIADNIKTMSLTKKDTRGFLRILLSRAKSLECDFQGRVLVPEKLLEFAGIGGSCMALGMINRIEMWNPDNWREYSKKSEEKYEDLAEKLESFS
ncbi:MAG: division/cell wall cluster transcriptional repressor MraZ [Elusimicrobia bacterium]|nr:division/cell wall cluster transcriptional repressor MraZ [Elusimicrobiota bacterium]